MQDMGNDVYLMGGLHRTPIVSPEDSITLEWNYKFCPGNDTKNCMCMGKPNEAYGLQVHDGHIPYYQVEISLSENFIQSALTTYYE